MRRRHFALEGAGSSSTQTTMRVLSLEEEAVVIDEAAQDAAEVERDLAEADRVLEVSDGLENLAIVADRIEEPTPEEMELVDTAATMAVAGTDIPPEEIVPAMESFYDAKNKRFALEGIDEIRATARRIWEAIQAFLKRVWENIQAYFRVAVSIPTLEKKIEAMEKKLKELGGVKQGVSSVKIGTPFLTLDGKMVKNGAALTAALRDFKTTADWVYGEHVEQVAKLGKDIAGVINKFTAEKSGETVTDLRAVLDGFKLKSPPGAGAMKAEGDFQVSYGKALLGGGHLTVKVFSGNKEASPLGALDYFRKGGVTYDGPQGRGAVEEVDFPVLTIAEAEGLLKTAKDLLKQLKDFHSGARLNKLKSTGDELKKASAKANSEIGKIKQEDKGQANVVIDYRAVLNFNAAYARWVHSPAIPFYGKSLAVSRAILMAVAKSATAYEAKGQSK